MAETQITDTLAAIGAEVRAARARRSMSQASTAQAVGISRDHFSHCENGDAPFPLPVLIRLSDVLGVTLAELVTPHPATTSHAA